MIQAIKQEEKTSDTRQLISPLGDESSKEEKAQYDRINFKEYIKYFKGIQYWDKISSLLNQQQEITQTQIEDFLQKVDQLEIKNELILKLKQKNITYSPTSSYKKHKEAICLISIKKRSAKYEFATIQFTFGSFKSEFEVLVINSDYSHIDQGTQDVSSEGVNANMFINGNKHTIIKSKPLERKEEYHGNLFKRHQQQLIQVLCQLMLMNIGFVFGAAAQPKKSFNYFDIAIYDDCINFQMECANSFRSLMRLTTPEDFMKAQQKNQKIYNFNQQMEKELKRNLLKLHLFQIGHRDIKPHNIVFKQIHGKLFPRFIDFGESQSIFHKMCQYKNGYYAGSLFYSLPQDFEKWKKQKQNRIKLPFDWYYADVHSLSRTIDEFKKKGMFKLNPHSFQRPSKNPNFQLLQFTIELSYCLLNQRFQDAAQIWKKTQQNKFKFFMNNYQNKAEILRKLGVTAIFSQQTQNQIKVQTRLSSFYSKTKIQKSQTPQKIQQNKKIKQKAEQKLKKEQQILRMIESLFLSEQKIYCFFIQVLYGGTIKEQFNFRSVRNKLMNDSKSKQKSKKQDKQSQNRSLLQNIQLGFKISQDEYELQKFKSILKNILSQPKILNTPSAGIYYKFIINYVLNFKRNVYQITMEQRKKVADIIIANNPQFQFFCKINDQSLKEIIQALQILIFISIRPNNICWGKENFIKLIQNYIILRGQNKYDWQKWILICGKIAENDSEKFINIIKLYQCGLYEIYTTGNRMSTLFSYFDKVKQVLQTIRSHQIKELIDKLQPVLRFRRMVPNTDIVQIIDILNTRTQLSTQDKDFVKQFLRGVQNYYGLAYFCDNIKEIQQRFKQYQNYRIQEGLNLIILSKLKIYHQADSVKSFQVLAQIDQMIGCPQVSQKLMIFDRLLAVLSINNLSKFKDVQQLIHKSGVMDNHGNNEFYQIYRFNIVQVLINKMISSIAGKDPGISLNSISSLLQKVTQYSQYIMRKYIITIQGNYQFNGVAHFLLSQVQLIIKIIQCSKIKEYASAFANYYANHQQFHIYCVFILKVYLKKLLISHYSKIYQSVQGIQMLLNEQPYALETQKFRCVGILLNLGYLFDLVKKKQISNQTLCITPQNIETCLTLIHEIFIKVLQSEKENIHLLSDLATFLMMRKYLESTPQKFIGYIQKYIGLAFHLRNPCKINLIQVFAKWFDPCFKENIAIRKQNLLALIWYYCDQNQMKSMKNNKNLKWCTLYLLIAKYLIRKLIKIPSNQLDSEELIAQKTHKLIIKVLLLIFKMIENASFELRDEFNYFKTSTYYLMLFYFQQRHYQMNYRQKISSNKFIYKYAGKNESAQDYFLTESKKMKNALQDEFKKLKVQITSFKINPKTMLFQKKRTFANTIEPGKHDIFIYLQPS